MTILVHFYSEKEFDDATRLMLDLNEEFDVVAFESPSGETHYAEIG